MADSSEIIQQHEDVANAIGGGNEEAAEALMRFHIWEMTKRLYTT
ncbi:hypothetical protein [Arthrobacter sulfonylureivorans]